MASLLGAMKELAAEIVLRDRTGDGAASAARNFERVGAAAEGAANVVERTSKISASAERSFERLERRLDPLAAATSRLSRDQDAYRRALEFGLVTQERYRERMNALQREYDETKQRIEATARAQAGLNSAFGGFSAAAGRLALGGLGVAGIGLAIRKISGDSREAIRELGALADKAKQVGGIGAAGFLQEARFALGQQGFDQGSADAALVRLNRSVGELKLGGGALSGALSKIEGGAALAEQLKSARDLRSEYELIIGKLNAMRDAGERAVLATAAFGKEAGGQIGAAAEDGVKGFRALSQEARQAGLVIDRDVIERADRFDDALAKAGATIKTQIMGALVEIGPVLVFLAQRAADLAKGVRGVVRDVSLAAIGPKGARDEQTALAVVERYRGQIDKLRADQARLAAVNPRNAEVAAPGVEAEIARIQTRLKTASSTLADLQDAAYRAEGAASKTVATIAAADDETASAKTRTDGLEKAWTGVSRAARKTREEVKGISDARLDALLAGAAEGDLAAAERRLEIEDRILTLRKEAGAAFLSDDRRAFEFAAAGIASLKEELAGLELPPPDEREAEAFAAPLAEALARVSEDFLSRLAQGDVSAFGDFAKGLKSALIDQAIRPAAEKFSDFLRGLATPGGSPTSNAFFKGIGLPGVGSFLSNVGAPVVGGALSGLNIGKGASDLLGLKKGSPGRGLVSGLVGGAAGATLAGAGLLVGLGASAATGLAVGATLGPIGAAIGALVGLSIALIKGKPSNRVGQTVFDPLSGANLGEATRDKSPEALANLKAARSIEQAVAEGLRGVLKSTGGDFGGLLLNAEVGLRGIRVGAQGANGEIVSPQNFAYSEDGVKAAIDAAFRLGVDALSRADATLGSAAKALASGPLAIDEVVSRLGALKDVLKSPDEFIDPLKDTLDRLNDVFQGLDRSAADVAAAFAAAAQKVAENVDAENRRALAGQDNPQLLAIEDLLKQQAARREEIVRLENVGGKVDATLLAEFQRRQLLNQFNASERYAQGADPQRAALDKLVADQARERAAFSRAVAGSGGLLTQADYLTLIRAQEAERYQAFKGLSDEDKARLSGRAGDFEDLTRQYALAVERLLAETEKLKDGFAAERERLQGVVGARASEIAALDDKIRQVSGDTGTPGQRLLVLRGQLDDLASRAFSPDEATKASARAALPGAVDAFLARSKEVYASGDLNAANSRYALDILMRVRDAAAEEKSVAQRQLDQLELMRASLDRIADLMAAPRLDTAALVAATAGLDANNPVALLAVQIADLEARQTAQSDRLIAALEALAPADVGLTGPSANALGTDVSAIGVAPAAGGSGLAVSAPSGSAAPARDTEVAQGMTAIADAIDDQTATIVALERDRRARDEAANQYLKTLVDRRAVQL